MVLLLTEGARTTPYSAMDFHQHSHAVVPPGAICGACTATTQTGEQ